MSEIEKKLFDEMMLGIQDAMHMNVETLTRLMLLCELLIEKGIFTEDEVMNKLSNENVELMLAESEDLI